MADTNTLLKYIKVRRLAEQGAPGERDNAARIVAKMEAEHPGIREQAWRMENPTAAQGQQANPFRAGNWENIFQWVQNAANVAYDFAQQAAQAQHGAALAEEVTAYTRATRAGRWVIGLKMDNEVYWAAKAMNRPQRELFRAELHELLSEQLDEMFDEVSEPDG